MRIHLTHHDVWNDADWHERLNGIFTDRNFWALVVFVLMFAAFLLLAYTIGK